MDLLKTGHSYKEGRLLSSRVYVYDTRHHLPLRSAAFVPNLCSTKRDHVT